MPRIEFSDIEEMIKWLDLRDSDKYLGYYTNNSELILAPNRSTQPILYGYIKNLFQLKLEMFRKKIFIPILKIKEWTWNSERGEYIERQ